MEVSVKLIVKGYVQGVGFRWFAWQVANRLGVNGHVKNLRNGDVEIVAEGERGQLEELINEIKMGPRFSKVTDVRVEWRQYENRYSSFNIEH